MPVLQARPSRFLLPTKMAQTQLYKTIFLAFLSLSLVTAAELQSPETLRFDSPGEAAAYKYWQSLWKQFEDFAEYLADEVLDPTASEELLTELEEIGADPGTPYVDCAGCRAILASLRALLGQGIDYWDVREEVIELCHNVVNASEPGSQYEVLCPGVCDNYGPHVLYILNTSTDTNYELCTFFNVCDPSVDPETTTEPPIERSLKQRSKSKRESKKFRGKGKEISRPNIDGAIRLIHFTDLHVDPKYIEGSATDCGLPLCCRDYWEGEGDAEYWGDYNCNLPPYTVELVMKFAASLEPDVLTYTGDSPPHAIWEETQWGQLNVSRWMAEMFETHFPGVPSYSTIGNHESYPTNLYYIARPEIQELNAEFGKYWTDLSGFTEEQLDTINTAGYYTIEVPNVPGLRVLSYNSNYGYTANFYGPLIYDSEDFLGMIEFMEDVLTAARENGEKILLLGHHPSGGSSTFVYYGRAITDLATRFGDVIIQHLQGHTHADRFRMTTDLETGEVYNVQFSAPSGTSRTDINPSVRLIYLDPDTLTPLDYDQYHLDLRKAMGGEEPELELFYVASEEYGLADLTPASYKDLVDRMEVDDELLDKYRFNERTGVREIGPCDESCKQRYMCELRTTSYDDYRDCRAQN